MPPDVRRWLYTSDGTAEADDAPSSNLRKAYKVSMSV